jgi:hypothetical protein
VSAVESNKEAVLRIRDGMICEATDVVGVAELMAQITDGA